MTEPLDSERPNIQLGNVYSNIVELNRIVPSIIEKMIDEKLRQAPEWFTSEINNIKTSLTNMDNKFTSLQKEVASLKTDMNDKFTSLKTDMDGKFTSLKADMDGKFTSLKSDMNGKFTSLKADMDGKFTSLKSDMNGKFTSLKADMDGKFTLLETGLYNNFASIDSRFAKLEYSHLCLFNSFRRMNGYEAVSVPFLNSEENQEVLPLILSVQDIDGLTKEECQRFLRGYDIQFHPNETIKLKEKLREGVGLMARYDYEYKFTTFSTPN